MTTALEDHLAHQLDTSRDFFWHRLRWRAVSRGLPKGRAFRLLDVGAGAGFVGAYLAEDLPLGEYNFVEPIAALEERLEQRYGASRNLAAAARYDGVEWVMLLDVLEHQPDDDAFLRALLEKVPAGARLVLTVPALPLLWSDWDKQLGHYRRYTKAALRRVLAGCPVDIGEISYLFPEMVPPALLRKQRAATGAEFPELPRWLNRALYAAGWPSLLLRRAIPFGSSLLAVARKREGG
jgi:SAM-dependent methyltransferase